MWNLPDLTGLFWLALIGLIAIGVFAVSAVGFLIWFFVFHVQFV